MLAAYEVAKTKDLAIGAGLQRRHQAGYIETINRLHDGAIGDVVAGRCYWNQRSWSIREPGQTDLGTSSATGISSPGYVAITSLSSTFTTWT